MKTYKRLLRELKKDERIAPRDYGKLLRRTRSRTSKRIIRSIIRDEKRHAKMLRKL